MTLPRVLVLEKQLLQRNKLVEALRVLGVTDILEAANGEQALVLMQCLGGVDIAFCDVAVAGMENLQFLSLANQHGLVRAVVLYGDLQVELLKAVAHVSEIDGIELLDGLSKPLPASALPGVLERYARHRTPARISLASLVELPSENELRRALLLRQFRAFFQPKYHLVSGVCCGVEVLARWQHPERGVLAPDAFLPGLVMYGLLDDMFKQLLEQGLGLLRVLRQQNQFLQVAFNLQTSQLLSSGLIDHIQSSLSQHRLCGSRLMFELSEHSLLKASTGTLERLKQLRTMGCGLAVDEFGTGFSSMRVLCHLPFNQLKLNAEFAQGLGESRSQAIIQSTLALGRSLNMRVVVERIASQASQAALVDMGCEIGQGFHYAKPMNAVALLSWIRTRMNQKNYAATTR